MHSYLKQKLRRLLIEKELDEMNATNVSWFRWSFCRGRSQCCHGCRGFWTRDARWISCIYTLHFNFKIHFVKSFPLNCFRALRFV